MNHTVKKFCTGNTKSCLKWKKKLDHIVKSKPYEPPKVRLDMSEVMLYGDLLESWKLWRYTEGFVEVDKKLKEG